MQLRFTFPASLRFELIGRAVTQGGMQAFLIVVPLDEFLDVVMQVLQILVLVGVDFLPLECSARLTIQSCVARPIDGAAQAALRLQG